MIFEVLLLWIWNHETLNYHKAGDNKIKISLAFLFWSNGKAASYSFLQYQKRSLRKLVHCLKRVFLGFWPPNIPISSLPPTWFSYTFSPLFLTSLEFRSQLFFSSFFSFFQVLQSPSSVFLSFFFSLFFFPIHPTISHISLKNLSKTLKVLTFFRICQLFQTPIWAISFIFFSVQPNRRKKKRKSFKLVSGLGSSTCLHQSTHFNSNSHRRRVWRSKLTQPIPATGRWDPSSPFLQWSPFSVSSPAWSEGSVQVGDS